MASLETVKFTQREQFPQKAKEIYLKPILLSIEILG